MHFWKNIYLRIKKKHLALNFDTRILDLPMHPMRWGFFLCLYPNFGSALDSSAVLYYNIGKRRILLSRRFL